MADINRKPLDCKVAILKSGKLKKFKPGQDVDAGCMNEDNYIDFQACEFVCKGCGCNMRPRLWDNRFGHFFAPNGHNKINGKPCPYYHENDDIVSPGNIVRVNDGEVEYAVDYYIDKVFKDKKEGGGVIDDPDDPTTKPTNPKHQGGEDIYVKNNPIIRSLKKIYEQGLVRDVTAKIGKYIVGELFIIAKTLIAGSVSNFNGRHIVAAESIYKDNLPEEIKEKIESYGDDTWLLRSEFVENSSFKTIYYVLTFDGYFRKDFYNDFKKKKPAKYEKYGYKCIFISDLTVKYDGDYMICEGNIHCKECYTFVKVEKD